MTNLNDLRPKAILLAAGRGKRLSLVAKEFYKPMVDIAGKPVISYSVAALEPFVSGFVVVANDTNANLVRNAVVCALSCDMSVEVAIQETPLGVANAVAQAIPFIKNGPAVIACGDNIFSSKNVQKILRQLDEGYEMSWSSQLISIDEASRYAVLEQTENGTRLIQKPVNPSSQVCWCGPVAVKDVSLLANYIENVEKSSCGEYEFVDVINQYLARNVAKHVLSEEPFYDVGTPASLDAARKYFKTNFNVY